MVLICSKILFLFIATFTFVFSPAITYNNVNVNKQHHHARPSQTTINVDEIPQHQYDTLFKSFKKRQNDTKSKQKRHQILLKSQQKANQFADFIVNSIASSIVSENLQPLKIPDYENFSQKLFGSEQLGELKLYNTAILRGLETIHRFGNATLHTMKTKSQLTRKLIFEIELKNIEIKTRYTFNLLSLGRVGQFVANSSDIKMSLEMSFITSNNKDIESDEIKITLNNLKIKELEPFNFGVKGFGAFNFIVKNFSDFMAEMLKDFFIPSLEEKAKKYINRQIREALKGTSTVKLLILMALQNL